MDIIFEGSVKKSGKYWLSEVSELDIMSQGKTRNDSLEMIADAIEMLVNNPDFKVKRGIG